MLHVFVNTIQISATTNPKLKPRVPLPLFCNVSRLSTLAMTTPKCSTPRTFDLNTNPAIQPSPYRMDGFVDYEMKVRGYELDQYSIVNNTVCFDYCYYGENHINYLLSYV